MAEIFLQFPFFHISFFKTYLKWEQNIEYIEDKM